MGNSRNSRSSELPERVAAVLAPKIFPGAHLALGLSGGLDSVALLSILLELAPALGFSLRAVHVNHGISPNAARWAEFCGARSEEHTSELQSQSNLVCRLLLEKKKTELQLRDTANDVANYFVVVYLSSYPRVIAMQTYTLVACRSEIYATEPSYTR